MNRFQRYGKTILLDILGVLLLFAALALSWVPGPGGIPLLIAGLSVLAINHEWARRILLRVKEEGAHLSDKIFVDRPLVNAVFDIATVLIITAVVLIIAYVDNRLVRSAALGSIFFVLVLFLANRKRYVKLQKLFKKT